MIQPGKFFTEYLDSLPKIKRVLYSDEYAVVETTAAKARKNGIIFSLPDHGKLTDRTFKRISGDDLRPPYECVILEYTALRGAPTRPGEDTFSKRLVIAIDMGTHVTVLPCAFNDRTKQWIPHIVTATFTYTKDNICFFKDGYMQVEAKHDVCLPRVLALSNRRFNFSNEELIRVAARDVNDEVNAYIDFCYTLHNNETYVDTVEPDAAKNKLRRSMGKAPLFTYKVLTVGKPKRKSQHLGGTHASPRSHLRRGFYRTSKHGVRHWVQPCMVKGETEGFVHKDYRVEGQAA